MNNNPQLYFIVKNQNISRIDKFEPVAKSKNYLYAHFEFVTDEWQNKIATAIFTMGDDAYEVILDADNNCLVPWEVLIKKADVLVSVYADDLITTNNSRVYIRETGYTEDAKNSEEPTPDIYSQILERLDYVEHNIDGGLFTDWKE